MTDETTAEAAACRKRVGSNFLPELPTPPVWKKFLLQFRDLFAVLLLAAAGISLLAYFLGNRDVYSLKVCIAILCVVLLNASIGFVQGYMAEHATTMLQKLVPHNARVLRDGDTLVLGDNRLIINPGSVGQPRDGDPRASYAIYDSEGMMLRLYRVEYNIGATQDKMMQARLPVPLVTRLEQGR